MRNNRDDISCPYVFVILLFIVLMILSWSAFSAGIEYEQGVIKQVRCIPPTTREDGTPITLAEIDHMEVYITQDMVNKGQANIANMECMLALDTGTMEPGQWYIIGVTVDTGGRKSVDSQPAPFTIILTLARPLPPVMLIE